MVRNMKVLDLKHLIFAVFISLGGTNSETVQQMFKVTVDESPGGVPFMTYTTRGKAECASVCSEFEKCEATALTNIPGEPLNQACELYDLSNAQSNISRTGAYMLRIYRGPQCIAGFTMSAPDFHCYAFIGTVMTWDDANTHCGSLVSGGHLVGIQSAEEDGFVYGLIAGAASWTWIGGKRPPGGTVDELYWTVTSEDLRQSYNHWMISRPDNHGGNQDCLALNDVAGEWNDIFCEELHPFVCEYIP